MNSGLKSFFNILILLAVFLTSTVVLAARKAKIVGPEVEVYEQADFDSEVMSTVLEGEEYMISDKTYGPFYRIKLKNGKIGYIVDYELDIEGVGRFKDKDMDELLYQEAKKVNPAENYQDPEEAAIFGNDYSGVNLQLVNFHEDAFGAGRVDDLFAVGYKRVSYLAWSVAGAFKAPKYYETLSGAGSSASGFKIWADVGTSNNIVDFGTSYLRFSPTAFAHFSAIQMTTTSRKYDLHDVTAGLAVEIAWLKYFRKSAIDLSVKYYFDKSNYSGLGFSYLF